MFILPFSPRWLISKGREEEAYKVVQRLHGDKLNEEFIKLEFAEMSVVLLLITLVFYSISLFRVEQIKYEEAHYATKVRVVLTFMGI